MKRFSKFTVFTIIAVLIFSLFSFPACSCDHEWEYIKSFDGVNNACREQYQCAKCQEYKYENVEHSYGSAKTVSATCTEKGGTLKECLKCGHKEYEKEIQALGHNYITEKGSYKDYRYEESTKCLRCGDPYYMLITTYAWVTQTYSGSNYWTFKGTVYNRLKKLTYVQAKLLIYNEYGRVIHTDWTYAVSSMPLAVGEQTSFELMISKSYCYGMEYFRWEYYA